MDITGLCLWQHLKCHFLDLAWTIAPAQREKFGQNVVLAMACIEAETQPVKGGAFIYSANSEYVGPADSIRIYPENSGRVFKFDDSQGRTNDT